MTATALTAMEKFRKYKVKIAVISVIKFNVNANILLLPLLKK